MATATAVAIAHGRGAGNFAGIGSPGIYRQPAYDMKLRGLSKMEVVLAERGASLAGNATYILITFKILLAVPIDFQIGMLVPLRYY